MHYMLNISTYCRSAISEQIHTPQKKTKTCASLATDELSTWHLPNIHEDRKGIVAWITVLSHNPLFEGHHIQRMLHMRGGPSVRLMLCLCSFFQVFLSQKKKKTPNWAWLALYWSSFEFCCRACFLPNHRHTHTRTHIHIKFEKNPTCGYCPNDIAAKLWRAYSWGDNWADSHCSSYPLIPPSVPPYLISSLSLHRRTRRVTPRWTSKKTVARGSNATHTHTHLRTACGQGN